MPARRAALAIHRLDEDEAGDAYNGPTKVGPMSRAAIEQMMRDADAVAPAPLPKWTIPDSGIRLRSERPGSSGLPVAYDAYDDESEPTKLTGRLLASPNTAPLGMVPPVATTTLRAPAMSASPQPRAVIPPPQMRRPPVPAFPPAMLASPPVFAPPFVAAPLAPAPATRKSSGRVALVIGLLTAALTTAAGAAAVYHFHLFLH